MARQLRDRYCIDALETKTCFKVSRLGEQTEFVLAKALETGFGIGRSKKLSQAIRASEIGVSS